MPVGQDFGIGDKEGFTVALGGKLPCRAALVVDRQHRRRANADLIAVNRCLALDKGCSLRQGNHLLQRPAAGIDGAGALPVLGGGFDGIAQVGLRYSFLCCSLLLFCLQRLRGQGQLAPAKGGGEGEGRAHDIKADLRLFLPGFVLRTGQVVALLNIVLRTGQVAVLLAIALRTGRAAVLLAIALRTGRVVTLLAIALRTGRVVALLVVVLCAARAVVPAGIFRVGRVAAFRSRRLR